MAVPTPPTPPVDGEDSGRDAKRRHLLAGTLVMEGESADRFHEMLTGMIEEFGPETDSELHLVESMAAAKWRQLRFLALDNVTLSGEILSQPRGNATGSPVVRAAQALRSLTDNTRTVDAISRYEARLDRQYRRSLRELEIKIARRKKSAR
jgi:hypothetical protein